MSMDANVINLKKWTLNVSPLKITEKPKGSLVGTISNSHNQTTNKLLSLNEIIIACTRHSLVAGHLLGIRNKSNFAKTNVILLDVDNGCLLGEFLEDGKSKGLSPNFTYPTLSDKSSERRNAKKFRVGYFLDRIIETQDELDFLLKSLIIIFPFIDPAAAKVAQLFFSGRSPKIHSTEPVSVDRIIELGDTYGIEQKDTKKKVRDFNYSRKKKKKNLGLITKHKPKGNSVPKKKRRGFNPEKLADECDLFNDFHNMERKILHIPLLYLYSVVRQFEGGRDYWESKVIDNPDIDDSKLDTIAYATESNYDNYHEHRTENSLPSEDRGRRYTFLSDALREKNCKAIPLYPNDETKLKSVEQVRSEFKSALRVAFRKDDKVTVLKCPCGVGKTTALKEFDLKATVIATPNHRLNKELERTICI